MDGRRRALRCSPNFRQDFVSFHILAERSASGRYGLRTIFVPSGTARQMSSISRSVTATRPSVQPNARRRRPSQPSLFDHHEATGSKPRARAAAESAGAGYDMCSAR
jgi:hypothetical protein